MTEHTITKKAQSVDKTDVQSTRVRQTHRRSYAGEAVQCRFSGAIYPVVQNPGTYASVQRQDGTASTAPRTASPTNRTGLPDRLKTGIESLSGYAMDDVRVHYNSSKPARLNALAYTQGSNIYVGPRQERHLPHEAWHVVQQKQGRVKPILQMKGGVNINDDGGLEKEADVMGMKGLHNMTETSASKEGSREVTGGVVQLIPENEVRQLAAVANHIDEMYPAPEHTLVGMGGSPAPIMAYFESQGRREVFNIPLSLNSINTSDSPKVNDSGLRELKAMLEESIPGFTGRTIVLLDVAVTGGSIARAINLIRLAYQGEMNPDDIKGVAIADKIPGFDITKKTIQQEMFDAGALKFLLSSKLRQANTGSRSPGGDDDSKDDEGSQAARGAMPAEVQVEARGRAGKFRRRPGRSRGTRSRNAPQAKSDFLAKLQGSVYKQYRPVGVFRPMEGDTWAGYKADEQNIRVEGANFDYGSRARYKRLVEYLRQDSVTPEVEYDPDYAESRLGVPGNTRMDQHKEAENQKSEERIRPSLDEQKVHKVQVQLEVEEEQDVSSCCTIL